MAQSSIESDGSQARGEIPYYEEGEEQPQVLKDTSTSVRIDDGNFPQSVIVGKQVLKQQYHVHHHHYKPTRPRDKNASPQPEIDDERRVRFGDAPGHSKKKTGVKKLPGGITLWRNDPINLESKIYKGEVESAVTREVIAIKIRDLEKNEEKRERQIREANILQSLVQHENIVRFISADVYEADYGTALCIAMELCMVKNLYKYIKELSSEKSTLPPTTGVDYAYQITNGLSFMHEKEIIHRDLKPDNILFSLNGKHLKLADFGLSKRVGYTQATRLNVGTEGWKAPETYDEKIESMPSDIFSLGLTIHFIWTTGKHPFGSEPDAWGRYIRKYRKLRLEDLPQPLEDRKELIRNTLQKVPSLRPTARDVLGELSALKSKISRWEEQQVAPPTVVPKQEKVRQLEEPTAHTRQVNANGVILFDKLSKHVWFFDCAQTPVHAARRPLRFNKLPPKPLQAIPNIVNRNHFSAVANGEWVYVLQNRSAHRFRFADKSSAWKKLKNLREDHGTAPPVAVLRGNVIVAGGGNVRMWHPPKQFCEVYNTDSETWGRLTDMSQKRYSHALIGYEDSLYAIGGRDDRQRVLDTIDIFNRIDNTWKLYTCPKKLYYSSAVAELNGKLYILGGSDGKSRVADVICFDVERATWSTVASMNQQRACFRACVASGRLFVVGGNQGVTSSVEVYDVAEDRFIPVKNLDRMNIEGEATLAVLANTALSDGFSPDVS